MVDLRRHQRKTQKQVGAGLLSVVQYEHIGYIGFNIDEDESKRTASKKHSQIWFDIIITMISGFLQAYARIVSQETRDSNKTESLSSWRTLPETYIFSTIFVSMDPGLQIPFYANNTNCVPFCTNCVPFFFSGILH